MVADGHITPIDADDSSVILSPSGILGINSTKNLCLFEGKGSLQQGRDDNHVRSFATLEDDSSTSIVMNSYQMLSGVADEKLDFVRKWPIIISRLFLGLIDRYNNRAEHLSPALLG